MDNTISLDGLCTGNNNIVSSSRLHHARRSLPIINCDRRSSLNVINENGHHSLSVHSLDNAACDSGSSQPCSPMLSPSSPQASLSTSPMLSRSLSPAAFSRIMRTPSPVRIARDCMQPRHGSISQVHLTTRMDEDDEEEDIVSSSLHCSSPWQWSPVSSANQRRSRCLVNARPPTPPPMCTEIAAVSQQLMQLAIRDKLHIPDRDFPSLNEMVSM